MKKLILTACLTLLSTGVISAQAPWTLRRCIDHALENNIEIKQQELVVENSEIELNTSQNNRLPSLSGSASQNFNFGRSPSMATGVYEDNQSASTSLSLNSSIPVFAGLRISNQIKSNQLDLKAATESLNKARENLGLQVASYYLEVLFKKEMVNVYREQARLTGLQAEQTALLVDAGKVPESQLYDIKAQLARDELNITTAANDLALSLLNLAQLLNIPDAGSFEIVEPHVEDDVMTQAGSGMVSPQEIYEIALGIKPHVREAEYRLESSKSNIKIAQSAFWPSVNIGLSYYTGFNHVFGSEKDNEVIKTQLKNNQREAIGLSLNIPIFNRMQTRNQVRSAHVNMENRMLELDNIKLALYKEIQQAHQSAVAAQAKYTSTQRAYEAANEAYKYAEERYQVGKSTVYELSEAQTKLLSSRSEQVQAKYDFLFRTKILDFYRGEPIDIY